MRFPNSIAALVVAFFVPLAQAATPASGTLSPATPELSYTYGPNAVSNPSATAELTCANPVVPCDAYALTVEVPAGSPAMTMTVSTAWSTAADDYDIYLLNSAGVEAGSSAGSANPETFTVPAVSGTYTVRVVPFAVTGSTANTTITLQAAAAGGGGGGGGGMTPGPVVVPATGLAPRYKIHVATGGLAPDSGEPTIGYNPLTKRAMFIAYFQANRVTFKENLPAPADALNATLPESCDALWEDKSGLLTTLNSLDPLMYTDKTTGRTFNSQLSGANSLFEFSDDDGESWTPGQIGPSNGGADHQTVGGGPYPAGSPFRNTPGNPGYAVYFCSQGTAPAFCSRSDNGGMNFGPGFNFNDQRVCTGTGSIHGHVQVAPVLRCDTLVSASPPCAGAGRRL